MIVSLKGLRFAFANHYKQGKPDATTGVAKYGGSFIFELNSHDPAIKANANAELAKLVAIINQVAVEKWQARSDQVLAGIKARGDVCLRDGNTKAEYEGFAGGAYVAASNDVAPNIVAKELFGGKPVYVAQDGRGFVEGVLVQGQQFKAPYGGCYVNVQIDIWAQDNQYGKRVNAKLLGIQFSADGVAFSGGAAFDEAGFSYDSGPAAGADPFAPGAAAGGFAFGGAAPAAATGGFAFGAVATPAAPAGGGFVFGPAAAKPLGSFF